MKLEIFFEKFDQFADAPDAVAKMRELVLQLAVQGKLVEHKLEDGDASQLIAAISRERDTQAKKLRKPKKPTSADDHAFTFSIPSNWVWTRLGNIALQIQYGYTASADPSATEIRMLRITDIQNNRVDWPSVPGCKIEEAEADRYLLSLNDILIARTGGTIGKSFIVPDAPVKSVFASYLIRITPPKAMVARYLKTFLESPLYWAQLQQMSTGTGQPNVNGQALGRLEMPLPPLAEQKRIVAKVDELMALCDRLKAKQQERDTRHAALARASLARFADAPTPANLQFLFHKSYAIAPADLRKSILTLAIQGKLVPQDPNDEPAEVLMGKIESDKKQLIMNGNIKSSKKLSPLTEEEKKFPLPKGWEWTRLQEAIDVRDGTHDSPKDSLDSDSYPLITSRNFENGTINFESARRISAKDHFEIQKRSNVEKYDILFSMIGGNIGNQVLVTTESPFSIKNVALFKYYNRELIHPYFIKLFLEHLAIRLQQEAIGGAQPFVSLGYFRKLPFPLPPTAEQHRIVTKADQLMALVDDLETQLAASRTTAKNLLEALVAELTAAGAPPPKATA